MMGNSLWMKIVPLICIFVLGNSCTTGHHIWVKFRNKQYMYVEEPMTWMDAQSLCYSIGGFLATVSNEKEMRFIKSMTRVSSNNVWLGATDMFTEGRWVWIENLEPMSYNIWYPGEPGEGKRANCLVWYHYKGFYWHDTECYSKRMFICQRSVKRRKS
ncbi:perlucin-like protein [Mytilus californianus]|uniref:perlucin-like protein n=1 Tax=Mytilus californianus TaxID=6549 RepID=UPI0022485D28|nr:perlucin-like protein [Mytilus californianus]